jgi:hypothetical protein
MNRYEARNLIKTSRHLLDPAKIQIFHTPCWDDGGDDVSFTCDAKLYRVKPQPRSVFKVECADRKLTWNTYGTFSEAEIGVRAANERGSGRTPYQITEFIEKL